MKLMTPWKTICGPIATSLILLAPARLSAQDTFERQLEDSPRHQEWVAVEYDGRTVHAFLVYPEVEGKAPTVVVIHENRGLNVWARTVVDSLAAAGYIAIAPDLLSGMGPGGGRTSDFESSDDARSALYQLDPDQITADLTAIADYVRALPAADSSVSVAGFCWGGSQTFRFATDYGDLEAAFVFYGTAPESEEELAEIKAPVYGFYGGNDGRVNQTIGPTAGVMSALGKVYEPVVYDMAGHGFMRRGATEGASTADAEAADAAWERWLSLLAE